MPDFSNTLTLLDHAIKAVSGWLAELKDTEEEGPGPIKVDPEIVPEDQDQFEYQDFMAIKEKVG